MANWRDLIVIAGGYAASGFLYTKLPEIGRPIVALVLPAAATITYALLRSLLRREAKHGVDATTAATYEAIVSWIVLLVVALHFTVLTGLVYRLHVTARLVPILLGFALVVVGNLLPRTRPNLVFGIRFSRALSDRGVWMAMNRIAGYVAVALGTVIAVSAALLPPGTIVLNVVSIAALVAACILVVYCWKHSRA